MKAALWQTVSPLKHKEGFDHVTIQVSSLSLWLGI